MNTDLNQIDRKENPPFQGDYVNTNARDNIMQHKLNILKAHYLPL